jgi:hypothetical protein
MAKATISREMEQHEEMLRRYAESGELARGGTFWLDDVRTLLLILDHTRAAAAETDALRAALAFYADEANYDRSEQCGSEACCDGGQRAREALAAPAAEDRFAAGRTAGLRDAAAHCHTRISAPKYDACTAAALATEIEAIGAADGADAGGRT